jgi:5-methyltetrahydrofolate--homocysteine methyltransferase
MTHPNHFEELLAARGVLVADGAMGTTLFSLGLEGGGCPELLNLEQPDLVRRVHQGFVDAGADIILTNTFGGNRRRLVLHGLQERVDELNAAAVRIAREVAESAGRQVIVAGSVGPTGDLFEPLGALTHDAGVAVFTEQCRALAAAGVDVLWIETISSWEELNAACEAAATTGIPFTATLSFDTNGRTMMGIAPSAVGEWLAGTPAPPLAVGANCGIGPGDAVAAAFDITEVAPGAVVIAKANCGIPLFESDRLVYPIGPEGMSDYVDLAIRSGARIIGTCCGSMPDHIAAVRAAVDTHLAGERPTRAEIEERLEAHQLATAGPRREGRRRG